MLILLLSKQSSDKSSIDFIGFVLGRERGINNLIKHCSYIVLMLLTTSAEVRLSPNAAHPWERSTFANVFSLTDVIKIVA